MPRYTGQNNQGNSYVSYDNGDYYYHNSNNCKYDSGPAGLSDCLFEWLFFHYVLHGIFLWLSLKSDFCHPKRQVPTIPV